MSSFAGRRKHSTTLPSMLSVSPHLQRIGSGGRNDVKRVARGSAVECERKETTKNGTFYLLSWIDASQEEIEPLVNG